MFSTVWGCDKGGGGMEFLLTIKLEINKKNMININKNIIEIYIFFKALLKNFL